MSNAVAGPWYIRSIIFKAKRSTVLLSERGRATCSTVFIALWKTRRLKHFRLRAQGGDNSSGDKVKLWKQTLTKDFGIGTHAGGLFPNEQSNCESDSEKDEVIYQFSDWVGSYSASELAKMQWDDPDIGNRNLMNDLLVK